MHLQTPVDDALVSSTGDFAACLVAIRRIIEGFGVEQVDGDATSASTAALEHRVGRLDVPCVVVDFNLPAVRIRGSHVLSDASVRVMLVAMSRMSIFSEF
jgi:hypothetical protein